MSIRKELNMKEFIKSNIFQNIVLSIIILNAIAIGIETYYSNHFLTTFQDICLYIFVAEIVAKYYYRDSNREFFTNGWNIFDSIIIGSAFIPAISSIATVLRILRVFRVLRLIDRIKELKLITTVLVKSFKSMFYVGLLMTIFFYIYAIIGVELFGKYQVEYATIHEAMFSLFRSLTCEDWTDLRYAGIKNGYWTATIYHVSWIIISTFLLVNLVIGAILDNYGQARSNQDKGSDKEILELAEKLKQLINERK